MTIGQAIKLATKNGWRINGEIPRYVAGNGDVFLHDKVCLEIPSEHGDCAGFPIESALMDPLFWKALGKSLDWGPMCTVCFKTKNGGRHKTVCSNGVFMTEEWIFWQRETLKSIAHGETIKSSFKFINK